MARGVYDNLRAMPAVAPPELTGIVVHWRNEAELAELVASWPEDPRFELIVVDNGSSHPLPQGRYQLIVPDENLGFGGGANIGARAAQGRVLLILNPDARPEHGALERLLSGFERYPQAAGLVPRLVGEDGSPQSSWQLRSLPSPWTLLAQTLLLPAGSGPSAEPKPGSRIEQPAAAALALRRSVWEAIGGFDESFHPAWFEDVDLAKRLAANGSTLLYWPAAVFRHGLGSSVPRLGYGEFLSIYYANLLRYLTKHHGRAWAIAARGTLAVGMALRLAALPLRKPRRSGSRGEAVRALLRVLGESLRRRTRRPKVTPS